MVEKKLDKGLVFSGVQPTGNLHLGNYLGAIKNWVNLQKERPCIFCIVDLHAITVAENRFKLKENTLEVAAAYISSGIDPKKSKIFIQSNVSGHSELAWILSCHTPIGWLNRMTQFKDKAGKNKEKAPLGLYSYPVLMAADILLYKSGYVPVGEDQKQHLELARDIAQQRINARFSKDKNILKIPQPIIMKNGSKIMSLIDGSKKMSKSDPNEGSRINLLDAPEVITKKIKRAKSDSSVGIEFNNPERPESKNLLMIYSILSGKEISKCENEFSETGWGIFKLNKKLDRNNYLIKDVVEKPSIASAPSNKAVIGRYILPNKIFSKLSKQKPGKGGEIHITDAIQSLIYDNNKFIAHNFSGKYLDCGSMNGYIKSSLEIAKS